MFDVRQTHSTVHGSAATGPCVLCHPHVQPELAELVGTGIASIGHSSAIRLTNYLQNRYDASTSVERLGSRSVRHTQYPQMERLAKVSCGTPEASYLPCTFPVGEIYMPLYKSRSL